MSDGDKKPIDSIGKDLGEVARQQDREAELWWQAIEASDPSGLPPGVPELEALKPLDDAERAALTNQLFGLSSPEPLTRSFRGRGYVWPTVGLALAAALALFFLKSPTLPGYQSTMSAGDQTTRSGTTATSPVSALSPGSRLTVVLRPRTPVDFPVEVSAELVDSRSGRVPWPGTIEHGRDGAFKLEAELGADLSPGEWRLEIDLRPDSLLSRSPSVHLEQRFQIRSSP